MNEYEHAKQSFMTALSRLKALSKELNELDEDEQKDKRYLDLLKKYIRNIAQDLIDELG